MIDKTTKKWIADWAPHLCHDGHTLPHLVIHSRIQRTLHGSCRKPHYSSDDALRRVDEEIRLCGSQSENRPSLLLMTGDQVYVGDVADPILNAIHRLSGRLRLFDEIISGATVDNGTALAQHEHTCYRRSRLLPLIQENASVIDRFSGRARKPLS